MKERLLTTYCGDLLKRQLYESAQSKHTYGTTKRAVHSPPQRGELDTHDTFSSGAYLVVMGMACTLFMLFTHTRLQFRIAGEVEPSTSE